VDDAATDTEEPAIELTIASPKKTERPFLNDRRSPLAICG
jgi:hypothetical protein